MAGRRRAARCAARPCRDDELDTVLGCLLAHALVGAAEAAALARVCRAWRDAPTLLTQIAIPGGGPEAAYPPSLLVRSLQAVRRCALRVEVLEIVGVTFASGGWEALVEALGEAPRLRRLKVDMCYWLGSCGPLAKNLDSGAWPALSELSLTRSDVSPEGVVAVGIAVGHREGRGIQVLDFGCNGVGPVADFFGDVTGYNSLRELRMAENGLGEAGMGALGACLAAGGFPDIEILDVSNNWATDDGVQALAIGLGKRDASLFGPVHLFLDSNSLGDPSFVALQSIMRRPGLETLSCCNNLLSMEVVKDLERIAGEVSLGSIDLRENPGCNAQAGETELPTDRAER